MGLKDDTLKQIQDKMGELGDLPVFTASVNYICKVSTDPDADAMSLSQEVLKDANLSVKLLRLANSPAYNRGLGKISVVSRAIVLLGFETVKNLSLTMKFIESFQHEHPLVDMDRLLIRAYISAGFVRDLAFKIGVKDVEETYTCALLHDLGEIAVAYFLPERYIEIQTQLKDKQDESDETTAETIETANLGASFAEIGIELADSWEFSSKVTSTMTNIPIDVKGPITKPHELNKVLAQLSSQIVGGLYQTGEGPGRDFTELMFDLSKATGVSTKLLESSLNNSFTQSCDLAKTYGLEAKKLMPVVNESGDEGRDRLARLMSYNLSSQLPNLKPPPEPAATAVAAQPAKLPGGVDPAVQLQFIQEITTLITTNAKLNTVLLKVMDGIHTALGFSRVVLCLLNMDRSSYVSRIVIGTDKEVLKDFFNRPLTPDTDIFSKIIMEGSDVIVSDLNDPTWTNLIHPKFPELVATNSFIASSISSGTKPLGFIYADKAKSVEPIYPEQQNGFVQFVSQARLALQICR